MITPNFFGFVKDGNLTLIRQDDFKKYLWSLSGRVVLTIKKERAQRSNPQNNLYWSYITIIADSLGYEKEELHDTFRAMFLTDRSKKLPMVRSTTSCSTVEFIEYIEKIKQKAAELGIVLLDPDEMEGG